MHSCGIKSRCIQALLLKSYKWMVRRIPDQRCSKSTCGAKNGITDACSTMDCYPLLTICPRCCPTHLPDDAIIHCRFPQDFPKISPRFIQDFPKIPQDSPRFPPRFLQDFPKWSPLSIIFDNMPQMLSQTCLCVFVVLFNSLIVFCVSWMSCMSCPEFE